MVLWGIASCIHSKMYCRNCGNELSEKAVMCISCGCPPLIGEDYCPNCKSKTFPNSLLCIKCGVNLKNLNYASEKCPDHTWISVTSMVIGILCFLTVFDVTKWDLDTIQGGVIMCAIGLILGLVFLSKKSDRGRGMAIAGVVLCGIGLTGVLARLAD